MRPARLSSAVLLLLGFAAPALAQQPGKPTLGGMGGIGGEERAGLGQYRSFTMSMPLTINRESVGRLELNLAGKASVAFEGNFKKEREEATEEAQEEKNESMRAEGKGAALFVQRYMDGAAMAGMYWGLGVGYREETVRWRVQPEESDKQVNFSLVDKDRMLNHDAELKGTTGHLRVGYRYVAADLPFVVGGYVGGRHFQAGVRDGEQTDEEEDANVKQAPLTDAEKERLRRKYTTKPEAGLELGITF